MMETKINPYLKFLALITQFILIFITKDIQVLGILMIINLLIIIILRVKLMMVIKFSRYGIFLALFALTFNYILTQNMTISLTAASNLFIRYLLILFASLIYKKYTINKELAFVISSVSQLFGANQNQVYTIILVVLNQIYSLQEIALNLYRFERFNNPTTNRLEQIKQIVNLLPVFISNALKQNENFTISLLNKNYHPENKKVNVYLIYNYSFFANLTLICYFALEIIIYLGMKG